MNKELLKKLIQYYEEFKTVQMLKKESSSFITTESYDCKLNNGKTIKREKILKASKDGSAAIVLPITEDNKVILAVEPRVFTEKTVDTGFPAGYIEDGENPIDAAKRELLEETGYQSNELECLGSFYQDQGVSEAYNHYFIARNCTKVSNQKLDEGEFIKYILVSFDELDELFKSGYIKGLNSAYLYTSAKPMLKNKEYIYEINKKERNLL